MRHDHTPCTGRAAGEINFTIDVWGAIRGEMGSCVVSPAQAIYDCRHGTGEGYDHNRIAVRCRFDRKPI